MLYTKLKWTYRLWNDPETRFQADGLGDLVPVALRRQALTLRTQRLFLSSGKTLKEPVRGAVGFGGEANEVCTRRVIY